jgi:hypothetical protein
MIKHTIYSKYSDARHALVINDNTITIKAADQHIICIGFANSSDNNYRTVEFTGGPVISVNDKLRVAGRHFLVKSIHENDDSYSNMRSFTVTGRFA